ncbi:MAG: hypothetical protein J6I64_09090 [Lachnospiraceae bacterium]|nr:hypothetical protein [Lachnospiraceae bacterium]
MAKRPKKWIPAAISCTLIVLICAVSGFRYIRERYSPSEERADLKELYQVTAEDEAAVLVNNLLIEEKAKVRDEEVYLSYSYVNASLNKRVYVDEQERLLLYALPDQVVEIPEGTKLKALTDWEGTAGKEGLVWYVDESDAAIYISITCLSHFTDLGFTVYTEPGRLYIDTTTGLCQMATVAEDTEVRKLGGIKSPIVADVSAGSQVLILDAMEEWSQVRTADGWIGYLRNKYLDDYSAFEKVSDFEAPVYTNISKDYEICLVWHQVFDQDGNDKLEDLLEAAEGVNTISPTWFALTDNEGNFSSLASTSYVEKAHALGLEVWGLVDNFSPDMSTHELLSRTSTRRNLIQNLLQAALEYDLDGINIDFEGMKQETGPHFVQFIRELSIVCRQNGLVLSIDNYVPSAGTKYYDRAEQAAVADYVIVMGYDEHWGGSTAGSTASLPFIRSGIENTLLEVPQDKLINALPFYTRVWGFDAAVEIPEGADPYSADYVISSTAVGMSKAKRLLAEHQAELVWDDEIGQYYGEYEEDGTLYRIWLEDATSLQAKLDVVAEYDLAGIAFWKLGLESDDAWPQVETYMNR